MIYELWETSSGNLVGTYTTEREALDIVQLGIERHGPHYADTFLLGYEDLHGEAHVLAEGRALADRACTHERGESA